MIWLTVLEVSKLLNVTERAIQLAAQNGSYEIEYIPGKGRGGKVLQIALESLPQEAQDKYKGIAEEKERLQIVDFLACYTDKQRKSAEEKARIVKSFHSCELSARLFVEQHNSINERKITSKMLYDWAKAYYSGGVLALIDKRGLHQKGKSSIKAEPWELFSSLYLSEQERDLKACYDLVKNEFSDIPSVTAFERRARKEFTEYVKKRYRGKYNQFRDLMPFHERTKEGLNSNDIWSSDHHKCDTFVLNSRGEAIRPTLTVITDIKSTKVIAYKIRETDGNTTVIKQCLKNGMKIYGIPQVFYTDNGKDYLSKELSNDFPESLTSALGIKQVLAQPYHGQSKPVERFFDTYENHLGKMCNTYGGSNVIKRTDKTKMTNKELAKTSYITPFDIYVKQAEKYIEIYNNTPHSGEGMGGKSPNEVYYENLKVKRQLDNVEALNLLCGRYENRIVGRNGVQLFNTTFMNLEGKLIPYFKKEVTIVYDPDCLDQIVILEKDTQKYICKAEIKNKSLFGAATEEDFRIAAKQRRNVLDYVNSKKPKQIKESEIFQLMAKNKLLERNFEE